MMTNKKLFYRILTIALLIICISLFLINKSQKTITPAESFFDYYGYNIDFNKSIKGLEGCTVKAYRDKKYPFPIFSKVECAENSIIPEECDPKIGAFSDVFNSRETLARKILFYCNTNLKYFKDEGWKKVNNYAMNKFYFVVNKDQGGKWITNAKDFMDEFDLTVYNPNPDSIYEYNAARLFIKTFTESNERIHVIESVKKDSGNNLEVIATTNYDCGERERLTYNISSAGEINLIKSESIGIIRPCQEKEI